MIHDSAAQRVVTHLTTLIDRGHPGERLPSVRSLMAELGVSPATVRAAVSELVRTERVEAIPGNGTFILATYTASHANTDADGDPGWQSIALAPQHLDIDFPGPLRSMPTSNTIDLASGYPDVTLQPLKLLAQAMRDAARRPGTFGRAPSDGIEALRSWFATELRPDRRHDVLITTGGQAALSLIFRSLALPGDTIAMEHPTYIGAIAAARAAGLSPVAVPIDSDGMRVEHLGAVIDATGARVVYLQPRSHNPTGASLAPDRRLQLMDIARERNLILIEDDWLHDLEDPTNRRPPLAANDPDGHVVYIRSLSKSVAPSMRIAAIASLGTIADRLRAMRGVEEFFVSPILQETALNVITSPAWPRHLRRLRSELAGRQQTLRTAIASCSPELSEAGGGPLHLWMRTPARLDAPAFRDAALRHGVSIVAGNQWYPSDPQSTHVRLSTASATTSQIVDAVHRLADAAR